MIPDFSGDFLNFGSTQDGDIIEIIDEGKSEYNDTLKKTMFNIKVRKGEKVMTYSPNNSSGKILQKSFGMDSAGWVGKKFQVVHANETMFIRPIANEKA